jgi:hypothetical protein
MRAIRAASLLAVTLATACTPTPTAPTAAAGTHPATIPTGSITVQALPVPSGWSGGASVVAGNGPVIGNNSGQSPAPLVAWLPPFSAPPQVIAASAGTLGGANDTGDFPGSLSGTKGAWLQTAPGAWSFTANPHGSYPDVSSHSINNNREMAGYVTLPGVTGPAAFRAAYFPTPGSAPIVLPLPAPSTIVGAIADDINNAGDIVGHANDVVGTTLYLRGTLWRRTGASTWTAELLPYSSTTTNSNATGINDAGQIAGYDGSNLVRWTPNGSGGWISDKVTTSGNSTHIDRCGRVVGTTAGKAGQGFVWDGSLTLLPLPAGAVGSGAGDIATDSATGLGVIVGSAVNKGGNAKPYPVRWTIPACP